MKRFSSHGKRILTPPSSPAPRPPIRAAHPAVRELWQLIDSRADVTVKGTARRAGLVPGTLRAWRGGTSPKLADVEAVLNTMGKKLVVVSLFDEDSMLTNNKDAIR